MDAISYPSDPQLERPTPPLQDGQRLTREEFHRRYEAMPDVKKAELIEGVVRMPSRRQHGSLGIQRAHLMGSIGVYFSSIPGLDAGSDCTLILDDENELQPDLCVFISPECGGHAIITEDDFLAGSPEFVADVTRSSKTIDIDGKLTAYRRHGIREYLVWRVEDGEIDWFQLSKTEVVRIAEDQHGIIRSQVLTGLWLDCAALLRDDLPRIHKVALDGIASPEHAAFVALLQKRASEKKS